MKSVKIKVIMSFIIFLLILSSELGSFAVNSDDILSKVIIFKDINFERAVRNDIGKNTGGITVGDVCTINYINLNSKSISNLEGIQYFESLDSLLLNTNSISDLGPLSKLINLNRLDLCNNNVKDVNALSSLNKLKELWLQSNSINNIQPLEKLTGLIELYLGYNNLIAIDAVKGLTNLTHLGLSNNKIINISSLEKLNNLTYLTLHENEIADVTPLSNLLCLTSLDLFNNKISDFHPLAKLINLNMLRINDHFFMEGENVKKYISSLKVSASIDILQPIVFKDPYLEDSVRIALNKPTGLIYPNDVKDVIRLSFGKRNITSLEGIQNFTNLSELSLQNNNVVDLTPLKNLGNMSMLMLNNNKVEDIKPLTNLINLRYLDLSGNSITDISPLAGHSRLEYLELSNNQINNISVLSGLKINELNYDNNPIINFGDLLNNCLIDPKQESYGNIITLNDKNLEDEIKKILHKSIICDSDVKNIKRLDFHNKGISNIEDLRHFVNLEELNLSDNNISDISALESLTKIKILNLNNNRIFNIDALKDINGLNMLYLTNNKINDISILEDHVNITFLELSNNNIESIDSLKNLKNLTNLNLSYNKINKFTILQNLSELIYLGLAQNNIKSMKEIKLPVSLQMLMLQNNEIVDITYLRDLVNLTDLGLSHNKIVNIDVLSRLKKLKNLWLSCNYIESIDSLKSLNDLQILLLTDNNITDVGPLRNFRYFRELDLNYNVILDISPIENLRCDLLRLWSCNSISDVKAFQKKADMIIKEVIVPGMPDYKKELVLHDYILSKSEYDSVNIYKGDGWSILTENWYNPFGLLLDGKGVCQAYALTMQYVLNKVGIECMFVPGIASGNLHAWNIVKIGGSYYHLDATWDDSSGKINHTYFNVNDDFMRKTRTWDEENFPKCVSSMMPISFSDAAQTNITSNKVSFTDLAGFENYAVYIESMASKGIINGVGNNQYAPGKVLTRAEFSKLLVTMLQLDMDNTNNIFLDIKATDWFIPYVNAAYNAGLIKGVGENKFAPNDTITTQDAALILVRALEYKGVTITEGSITSIKDYKDISSYAEEAVGFTVLKGVTPLDSEGNFNAKGTVNRASAAEYIYNVFNYTN